MTLTALDRGFGDPRHADFYKKFIVPVKAGGISVNVHRDLAYLTQGFLTQITDAGYKLNGRADDWGYANRAVRGYELKYKLTRSLRYLSNHAWGTAIDLNATTNPMTKDGRVHTDMPHEVIDAAHTWGWSWGGDYVGQRKDPMHFEMLLTKNEAVKKSMQISAFLSALSKGKKK